MNISEAEYFLLVNYDTIILDCDGVILNSNFIKENNIKKSLSNYLDKKEAKKCLEYFNDNPGIPREIKLAKFINDKLQLLAILDEYKKLNLLSLKRASLVKGVKEFIIDARNIGIQVHVISGGDQDELCEILRYKNIFNLFNSVNGGPKTKKEHFSTLKLSKNSLFFGDSIFDYKIAQEFNIDFVFIYAYSNQILRPDKHPLTLIAPDFRKIKIKKHD